MKRPLALLLCVLLCLLTACAKDTPLPSPLVTEIGDAVPAQYIRTGYTGKGMEYHIIRSKEELNTYYEQNKDTHNLERREHPAADSTIGFLDACDRYDAAFFEDRALVLILVQEPSGSNRHRISMVQRAGDCLTIRLNTLVPEVGTCDMAGWHILVEVARTDLPSDDSHVLIYHTDKLAKE